MMKRIVGFFKGEKQISLQFEYVGVVRYIPLIVCGGFFLATILIFGLGPMDWHVKNPVELYTFLGACCVFLTAGYILGVKKGKTPAGKLNINTNTVFMLCAATFFIIYFPTVYATTGKWYPDVVAGIADTGRAYRIAKYYSVYGPKTVQYIRMLLAPLTVMVIPVTLFFMPKLSKTGKVLGITAIILSVALSISQGVNKAVADFTAQIVLFLIMLLFTPAKKGSDWWHRLKVVMLIILVCGLFFSYNSASMRNRVALDKASEFDPDTELSEGEIDSAVMKQAAFGFATEKEGYVLMELIPEKLRPAAIFFMSYISHGYKGLSIAMEQEFTSTFGLGFSDFFRHNFLRLAGRLDIEDDIYEKTYMYKTNRDCVLCRLGRYDVPHQCWRTGAVWSTFFVYPASDISFYGTAPLLFIIGYLFSLSWKDALMTENPFAATVFYGFCIIIFYFSANNQTFQGGETFIGLAFMIMAWLVSRRVLYKKALTGAYD